MMVFRLQKVSRRTWKFVVAPVAVFLLVYGYFLGFGLLMMDSKYSGQTFQLIAIAQGRLTPLEHYGFDWELPPPRLKMPKKVTCTRYGGEGEILENQDYQTCITPYFWAGGPGCAWWRFEACDAYAVDDFILTQQDVLMHTLRALREPCTYLPPADEFQGSEFDGIHLRDLTWDFRKFSCDKGEGRVPHKVVINVQDDEGHVIAQFKHLPYPRSVLPFGLDIH